MIRTTRAVPVRRLALLMLLALPFAVSEVALPLPSAAQARSAPARDFVGGPGSANYQLAARFAPYRISDLLKSTTLSPRWIDHGDKFWYEWETTAGTSYYLVDPVRGT